MADEPAADLYELTQEVCDRAGLPAYEISNHSRSPGRRSRHNLIYWRGGEWVGVGPGAHGRIELAGARLATEAAVRPADYCAKVAAAGVGWAGATPLAPLDQARERVAMGLRWVEGFAPADLAALGLSLDAAGLDEAVGLGLAETADGAVRLTRRGRLVADRVAAMISP
jgi:oxygen-independent coproporphyrinogen-3 oxidase